MPLANIISVIFLFLIELKLYNLTLFVCLQVADMKYLSFTDIELLVKDATIPLWGNSPASKTNEALSLLHQPEASYNTQPC